MPIAVLSEYTEKEYEPFDPYSRFYPAMPISVCFSDTALCTLGESPGRLCALCAPAAPPAGHAPDLPQDEKAARVYAPGRWMPVEKRRAAPQSWGALVKQK